MPPAIRRNAIRASEILSPSEESERAAARCEDAGGGGRRALEGEDEAADALLMSSEATAVRMKRGSLESRRQDRTDTKSDEEDGDGDEGERL